jgi:hypothetical protein
MSSTSSEEMKDKAKQSLKMILLRTDDLDAVEPLLSIAPPKILKYVVALYSKVINRLVLLLMICNYWQKPRVE